MHCSTQGHYDKLKGVPWDLPRGLLFPVSQAPSWIMPSWIRHHQDHLRSVSQAPSWILQDFIRIVKSKMLAPTLLLLPSATILDHMWSCVIQNGSSWEPGIRNGHHDHSKFGYCYPMVLATICNFLMEVPLTNFWGAHIFPRTWPEKTLLDNFFYIIKHIHFPWSQPPIFFYFSTW